MGRREGRWGCGLLLPQSLLLLLLLLLCGHAHATLVAYYSFDNATVDSIPALSGYCPANVPVALAGPAFAAVNDSGMFNQGLCFLSSRGYMGTYTSFLNTAPAGTVGAISLAAWVMVPFPRATNGTRVLLFKNAALQWQIATVNNRTGFYNNVYCMMQFSLTGQNRFTTTTRNFGPDPFNYWTHVACVYNSTNICVYVNGTRLSCSAAISRLTFPYNPVTTLIGNTAVNGTVGLWGCIDELKIYDHALSDSQLYALAHPTAGNVPPAVTIGLNTVLSVPQAKIDQNGITAPALSSIVLNTTNLDTTAAFSGSPNVSTLYSWTILSSNCGLVDSNQTTTESPLLSLLDVGNFQLQLCASDGETASVFYVQAFINPSVPYFSVTPVTAVTVELGAAVELHVEAVSVPAASYQWQYLTYENSTDTTNSTETTTFATMERSFEYLSLAMHDPNQSYRYLREVPYVEERDDLIQVWVNFPNQTRSTFLMNSTDIANGTVVRCRIRNGGGAAVTSGTTITTFVAPPTPSPTPSPSMFIPPSQRPLPGTTSSDSVGAIVGGVIGGVTGLAAFLALILAVLAFLFARRRLADRHKKLSQPDYEQLIYGDVADVALSKKKAEAYRELERVLLADEGRLAHAIFASIRPNQSEKMAKAIIRVFEANQQGSALMIKRISHEVDLATEESTLFRSNSIAAKMYSAYVRMVGLRYLWHTLVLSVHSINDRAFEASGDAAEAGDPEHSSTGSLTTASSSKSKRRSRALHARYKLDTDDNSGHTSDVLALSSMEIDPLRMNQESDSTINTLELWLVAQKMLKVIVDSERAIPVSIRRILRHVNEEIGARYGDLTQYRAIGGFYFLRLICPALMAPQVYGLLEEPPHPMAQRQLILIAKVIQNLANDTMPGAKEEYMEKLNAFITSNKPTLERFYSRILDNPDNGKDAHPMPVPDHARDSALITIHHFLAQHRETVEQAIREDQEDSSGGGSDDSESLVEELRRALDALGDPSGDEAV